MNALSAGTLFVTLGWSLVLSVISYQKQSDVALNAFVCIYGEFALHKSLNRMIKTLMIMPHLCPEKSVGGMQGADAQENERGPAALREAAICGSTATTSW